MIDTAYIDISAGNGGNGIVSFRREKFVPKGGPDGGDGGDGGDIYFIADQSEVDLTDYGRLKKFKAKNGESGMGKKKHGKNGSDLYLKLPKGTMIYALIEDHYIQVADIIQDKQVFKIASGGKGGLGNTHFSTSTYQTPRIATEGKKGESKTLFLNLKLIADVGFIGIPNAGKSSLLKELTKSHPKIGDYPFTTIEPNLGALPTKEKNIIIADVPGLIKDASKGKGLGIKFLRHIERTSLVVHLVSADSANPEQDYLDIKKEMINFNPTLKDKKEIIAVSKFDLTKNNPKIKKFIKKYQAIPISIYDIESIAKIKSIIIDAFS